MMFNLEKEIKDWKKSLRKNQSLEDGYIAELESHLRDEIEKEISLGLNEEEAFIKAKTSIGSSEKLASEYYKSDTKSISGKPSWEAPFWMPDLFFNYLKTGLRIFNRYKGFSFINLFGLIIGITSCALIAIYIVNELSYDKHHINSENIYRVAVKRSYPNQEIKSAATQRPFADYLRSNFPEVINAARVSKERAGNVIVKNGEKSFYENHLIFSDNNLFEIFTIPFIKGDPEAALSDPFSIVISEETANKYFGESNPIGKILSLKFKGGNEFFDYYISGVFENHENIKSHLNYDLIATYKNHPYVGSPDEQDNWEGLNLYTYIQLQSGLDIKKIEEKLNKKAIDKIALMLREELNISYEEYTAAGNGFSYFLQPLTSIHLYSDLSDELEINGDILYVYLFSVIAVMVLVLAGINFMNLSIARYSTRLKEIAVRKVFGSQRKQLIVQFLSESFVISFLALILSVIFVPVVLPYINSITGLDLSFNLLNYFLIIIGLSVFVVMTGLLSNLYPALYLSSNSPYFLLKGILFWGSSKKNRITNGMVVFQFVISISLIICTLVIAEQNKYLLNKKLGFEKDQVLIIEGSESVLGKSESFRNSLENYSDILSVTNSQAVPGNSIGITRLYIKDKPENKGSSVEWLTVGFNYLETFGLKLISGRDFNEEIGSDSMAVILNETAVKSLNLENPVGEIVLYEDRPYTIIGVLEDFHFSSLHRKIQPMAIFGPDPYNQNRPNQILALRIKKTNVQETINYIRERWGEFTQEQQFIFSFLDKKINSLYQRDLKTRNLFAFFTIDAILIGCVGLFGLSSFAIRRKTKDIGTRKVLGATTYQIIILVSSEFIKLVLTAYLVAVPISYFSMTLWLNEFAYSISLKIDLFIIGAVISILLTTLTVGYQTLTTALSNPIKALKYE